jgi:type IV pilus assembly protein PilA
VKKILKRNNKGFTLIELMIVVAIIGILAAIAIPNFLHFQLKARTAEAKKNLGEIKTCEEIYNAEHDRYMSAQIVPRAQALLNNKRAAWPTNSDFVELGFDPIGSVYFSYAVTTLGGDNEEYSAEAYGDIDDDDVISTWRMSTDGSLERVTSTGIY